MHETIGICPICKEEKVKFVRLDFNIYQYECRRCGWIKIQEVSVLDRYDELKKIMKEYDELDKVIKEKLKGVEKTIVGHWLIQKMPRKVTKYEIPEDLKKQYAIETSYWTMKMTRL